jgi:hypothetical protein
MAVSIDTGCGSATDTAKFNFETDTQGWTYVRHITAGRPAPVVSTAQHCNGKSSLEYTLNVTGNETGDAKFLLLGADNTPFGAGTIKAAKRVVIHVWVPASPEINFQPFVAGGCGEAVGANSYAVPGGIHRGGWTKFTVESSAVTAGCDQQIGIDVFTTASFSGKIYVDSVALEN